MAVMINDVMHKLRNQLEEAVRTMRLNPNEAEQIWRKAEQEAHYGYTTNRVWADEGGPEEMIRRITQSKPIPTPAAFDPNTVESLNIDLDTLTGIWVAKYGSTWVKDTTFAEGAEIEAFWHHAFKRLRLHQKFEHYADWSKLKEVPNGYV